LSHIQGKFGNSNKTKNEIKNLNLSATVNENILVNLTNLTSDKRFGTGKNNLSNLNNLNSNITENNLLTYENNLHNINLNLNDLSTITMIKNSNNNFLKEITNKSSFLNHLKLFEINLEIDDAINNYSSLNIYDNYYVNSYIKSVNKHFIFSEFRKYFQILKKEFLNGNVNRIEQENLNETEFNFFIDEKINLLYEKLLKLQMIVFSILLVLFKNLNLDDNVKVHIRKLCSSLIYPMINFYDCFVMHHPLVGNDIYIKKSLSPSFRDKFKKIHKFNRMNKYFSIKDNIFFLNKFSDELMIFIKQFPR